MTYIMLDSSVIYYAIDLCIILALMVGLRFISGLLCGGELNDLLAKHDNHAVGIALAGMVLGVAIILMGASSGEASANPAQEAIMMLSYGILGIALMWLTSKVFDHLIMPEFSVREHILQDNRAAAIIDAGNMIGTALIVRAVMTWVDTASYTGLLLVLIGFIISQLIMYLAAFFRMYVYKKQHSQGGLYDQIIANNQALAVRFAGHRIGVGLAVTAASGIVVFSTNMVLLIFAIWLAVALAMFIAQGVIGALLRFVLLRNIDVADEVDNQNNMAIGVLEAAIYIAVGLIFVGLFAG
ncbi:MAG: DUF350 domain-containing protein [Mariprofundales bacterium]